MYDSIPMANFSFGHNDSLPITFFDTTDYVDI